MPTRTRPSSPSSTSRPERRPALGRGPLSRPGARGAACAPPRSARPRCRAAHGCGWRSRGSPCRTWHSAQIALARASRASFSSLRSACDGGKNAADCGPRHAPSPARTQSSDAYSTPSPLPLAARVAPHGRRPDKGSDQGLLRVTRPGSRGRRRATLPPDGRRRVLRREPGAGGRRQGRGRQDDRGRRPGPHGRRRPGCRSCSSSSRASRASRRPSAATGRSTTTDDPDPASSADGRRARSAGRWITPDDALLEYLADHGLQRVSRRLVSRRRDRRGRRPPSPASATCSCSARSSSSSGTGRPT